MNGWCQKHMMSQHYYQTLGFTIGPGVGGLKKGTFLYPGTRRGGGENALTIHKIYAALTPSDSRSDWA